MAEKHTTEHGKRQFSYMERMLGGRGYNGLGMKHHKVSIKYIKIAGVGMAFFILNFLLIIYFAPNSPF